ncbi:MAG: RibD family protein, partial [Verrucomicrobiota bacterium]
MAASFDGKIATADRQIVHFGSPKDQHQLYALRATADAILCGARTVEEADATLGNGGAEFTRRRRKAGRSEYPLRVIVSGRASLSSQARIWSTDT